MKKALYHKTGNQVREYQERIKVSHAILLVSEGEVEKV